MKRKIVLALACLSIVLLASFALFAPIPPAYASTENHRYWVMGGEVTTCTQTGPFPKVWTVVTYPPMLMVQNITFSDPDPTTGVVDLTVPTAGYVGIEHIWFDETSGFWYRLSTSMEEDGYGWLFTGEGGAPILGDVDIITFNNDTGVYFFGPDGLAGTADDSSAAPPPQTGPDGVPGTADDDFGTLNTTAGTPRTPDPPGSSVLYIPGTLHIDYWIGAWASFFVVPLPQIMTTAVAYDVVIETASKINGANSTGTGQPWEFIAGIEHPPPVPHGHLKWNAYVTYVCAWSVLNIPTAIGPIDIFFEIKEKKVREDVAIADTTGDEKVSMADIVVCALAFGAQDEGPGEDGIPDTPDDKKEPDANYDARGDFKPTRGKITMSDLVTIALDFGAKLTPDCVIRP